MSSASETTRHSLMRKSTSFSRRINRQQQQRRRRQRRVDGYDQVVYCDNCGFVAPMSISFEEYLQLHGSFNEILGRVCGIEREIVVLKDDILDVTV
ncbi:hypothetical protein [Alphabaculovirus myunipunctae]|uniref:Uncharacterized protein n=1 Tax=Mythimna unipuncta nucleopolyhedrovirus TaxID=447897 RepID=A0A2K9VSE1_9ABAC|nr:hypothetical protein [Mythimna unipuncta nucleopolyhedrovirus]AUV65377.1 hypothetical protein [Mythimna unipuncta nucleopolyhedrovirus]